MNLLKTKNGETRYSGQSGGDMPKFPWDDDTIKYMIVNEFNNKILNTSLFVSIFLCY